MCVIFLCTFPALRGNAECYGTHQSHFIALYWMSVWFYFRFKIPLLVFTKERGLAAQIYLVQVQKKKKKTFTDGGFDGSKCPAGCK